METGKYAGGTNYIEEVAAYIRVSTQEQKLHGISLEAQMQKLEEYAAANNMKIVEWYKDEGISGRKLIKKRPELQRMIQDAEKRRFKRIIFIKLDRFFRSVAEYHECMKRLSTGGVIWTATEEKYDLSTASGEAFVNMKLTMAQFEADQTGERIRMVNDYKIQTGQPLYGSQCFPFCYTVGEPKDGERHKYIKKQDEDIMIDLIDHVFKNKSIRAAQRYINHKYHRSYSYNAIMKVLNNEMICGSYKGNPNYCDPYITPEQFDELKKIISRNPRTSQNEHTYIFTGLIRCPDCGRRLSGAIISSTNYNKARDKKTVYSYYGYRCQNQHLNGACSFNKVIFENRIEKDVLSNIEKIVKGKKTNVVKLSNEATRVGKYDLESLKQELDRLNYAWQKGRIKTVEEYDKQYDELIGKIEAAQTEQKEINNEPDYENIQKIISGDWKSLYNALDAEHKRSFWRSFVDEIHVEWDLNVKRIDDIIFF